MTGEQLRRGALYMLASALLFAAMGALIKLAARSLPNEMVVFFRNALGLAALAPWLWRHGWHGLRTRHPGAHLARALAGLAAMYCYFYALAHLPLAEATLLNYSTPLFIPFIAWLWLGESVPRRLWWAIATGFAGIVLILKPGLGLFTPVALVGAAAGLFGALAMVGIRRLTRTEPALRVVFYFALTGTLVSAVPLAWSWRTPPPGLWALLVAIGAVASLAQWLMTRAYAQAPAAQVGPFSYATVVFAALAGWALWGEVPDAPSALGALLVVAAGVLTIRQTGRQTAPAAELPNRPPG
jgi:drug/metabolite transporter (DMT)-like permease